MDARNIDWGSASVPKSGDIQGSGVLWVPWVGYTPPPRPPLAPPQTIPADNGSHCETYAAFGLRGSQESPPGDWNLFTGWSTPTFSGEEDGFGANDSQVLDTFKSTHSGTVKKIAIQYQALPVPVVDLRVSLPEYVGSIYDGVDKMITRAKQEVAACKDVKFVIIGYSQGALAAHIALRQLADSDPAMLARFVGVAFIADPGRVSGGQESWWRSASLKNGEVTVSAPTGSQMAVGGIWSQVDLFGGNANGPLPAPVVSRTVALCHKDDLVCSGYVGSGISEHLDYTPNELNALGYILSNEVP